MLPLIRLLQSFMPLPLASWANKRSAARVRLAADVAREAVSADGVPCVWLAPQGSRTDHVLLYLHGGGFVYGLTSLHLEMGAYLARRMGIRVLMVDYRLAPDHPFPAALDDCVTAYRWLLAQGIEGQHIVVAGDSAGGNLTVTTLMRLRDGGSPLPAAAACLSPVIDLTADSHRREGFRDPLLPSRGMKRYTLSYLGHHDAHDPLISPAYGRWHGLPPLLVHAGDDEILRDDAIRVKELATSAGVDVRLEIYPRMWHVWQLFLALPQATDSLDDIAQFLTSHLEWR